MEREDRRVTVELSLSLHKAFRHKLTDEERTAKAAIRQLIELWVKGDIVLPEKPAKLTRQKKT